MKKIISICLILALLAAFGAAFAIDAGQSRVVLGADISQEQAALVYQAFSVTRGSVTELTVTNSEERQYLNGLVDSSIIGTRSISCVYIETLASGSGLDISTSNIDWCTQDMYRNALITAGIYDAKVIVAAPFSVSGTAGLTGIYKAYEDITGEQLDYEAKLVGTQELVTTAELADAIGSYDAVTIVNELKLILSETVNMTDEELRIEIINIANEYNVTLTDSEINQLITLCRSLEGLSTDELQAKVESVQETLRRLNEAQETASTIITAIKNFFVSIGNFFSNLFGGGGN